MQVLQQFWTGLEFYHLNFNKFIGPIDTFHHLYTMYVYVEEIPVKNLGTKWVLSYLDLGTKLVAFI